MRGVLCGSSSVVLDNGEVCKGPWAFVSYTPPGTSATAVTPIDTTADWDSGRDSDQTDHFPADLVGEETADSVATQLPVLSG
jgi:hypothetical protein